MARKPKRYQPEPANRQSLVVYASRVKGGAMRRVLQLSGDLDLLVEYDGRLLPFLWHDLTRDHASTGGSVDRHEIVRVNGRAVLMLRYDSLYYHRHTLVFDLPAAGRWVRAFIRLSVSSGLRSQIESFQLSVDGKLVYEESPAGIRARSPLGYPLPAGAPAHRQDSCPVVEAGEEAPPESFPIPKQ